MKSLCVITIHLNTLTDVPYEMTVGGAFVYVCERDRVKDFVYITRSVITRFFPRGPRRPRYNGVAVYTCITIEIADSEGDYNYPMYNRCIFNAMLTSPTLHDWGPLRLLNDRYQL